MKKEKFLNGIDVERLFEIMNILKKHPELAKFRFRAQNTWMNSWHSRSIVKGFYGAGKEDVSRNFPFIFDNDQPLILTGDNKGPNPLEYILNALAGCMTNSIILQAVIKGIHVEEIESEIEGSFDLRNFLGMRNDNKVPFEGIRIKIRIKGSKISADEKIILSELGKESSPVYKIITDAFPVAVSIEKCPYDD